jgi:hypothetical protein
MESQPPGPMESGIQLRHACPCPGKGRSAKRHKLIFRLAKIVVQFIRDAFIRASLAKNLFVAAIIFASRLNY